MKFVIAGVLAGGFASQSFAHGPIASQAATAVTKATALFLEEPERVRESFELVSCVMIGEERFRVEFSLKGGSKLNYACGLDESVKPVKWGCKKAEKGASTEPALELYNSPRAANPQKIPMHGSAGPSKQLDKLKAFDSAK